MPGLSARRALRAATAPGTDASKGSRLLQSELELLGAFRQPEGFERRRRPSRPPHEHEVARVGHWNESVTVPVAADLAALRGQPGVLARGLHLYTPRSGVLPGPLISELADAENLGLQGAADGIRQVGERSVAGALAGGAPEAGREGRSGGELELRLRRGHRRGQRGRRGPGNRPRSNSIGSRPARSGRR